MWVIARLFFINKWTWRCDPNVTLTDGSAFFEWKRAITLRVSWRPHQEASIAIPPPSLNRKKDYSGRISESLPSDRQLEGDTPRNGTYEASLWRGRRLKRHAERPRVTIRRLRVATWIKIRYQFSRLLKFNEIRCQSRVKCADFDDQLEILKFDEEDVETIF